MSATEGGAMPRYGIVLLLDPDTAHIAALLSEEFAAGITSSLLTSGTEANQPHISLFHLMLEERRLSEAHDVLQAVARMFLAGHPNGLRSRFERIELAKPDSRWLFWRGPEVPRIDDLRHLHDDVVTAFAPMRAGSVEISWPMDSDEQELHADYGYPGVRWRFDPHLTLAVLAADVRIDGFRSINRVQDWRAASLVLAELNSRGQILRIEHSVSLLPS